MGKSTGKRCSTGYTQKLAAASANLQLALFSIGFLIRQWATWTPKMLANRLNLAPPDM